MKLFLDSAGVGRKVVRFRRNDIVFAQGDPSKHVAYIQEGSVKLSVVNETGKEAVVAILVPGDFLGEGCIAGQSTVWRQRWPLHPPASWSLTKTR